MNRLPMVCTSCQKSLMGGLDTFGEVGQEMCWECHSSLADDALPTLIVEDTESEEEDDLDIEDIKENGGLIESRGMLFCFACGMLAQPGDENFDWCDHLDGIGCPYYVEEMDDFDNELDDVWEDE